jgi:hypothetical protein
VIRGNSWNVLCPENCETDIQTGLQELCNRGLAVRSGFADKDKYKVYVLAVWLCTVVMLQKFRYSVGITVILTCYC